MGENGKCFISQKIIVYNKKDKSSFRSKEQSPLYCFLPYTVFIHMKKHELIQV